MVERRARGVLSKYRSDEQGCGPGGTEREQHSYLRQQRLLPLTTLLKVDHNSPYYHEDNKGSVFYAESWALVHYLEITDFDNKTNRLQDYMRLADATCGPCGCCAARVWGSDKAGAGAGLIYFGGEFQAVPAAYTGGVCGGVV